MTGGSAISAPDANGTPPSPAQEPLAEWHRVARDTFVGVGVFSVFVNLLMLTMPIYLFQISDRVLTSRSIDTLIMLSLLALGFIVVLSLLDILRRQVLGRLATRMETILGGPILASIVSNAPATDGGNVQPLRSLHQVRGFISSPTMLHPVRCADGAALLRGRVPHPPRPGLHRCRRRRPAVRHRAPEPARDVRAAGQGRRARIEGRRAGRVAGAQRAGHQRHGHAEREHPAVGPRAGERADAADARARPQLLDQRHLALLAGSSPRSPFSAGAPIWRSTATSPAA